MDGVQLPRGQSHIEEAVHFKAANWIVLAIWWSVTYFLLRIPRNSGKVVAMKNEKSKKSVTTEAFALQN